MTKSGACGKTWTETQSENYMEEDTVGFKISRNHLKQCWTGFVNSQVEVSRKSTELLIQQEIIGEIERVQIEVTQRCDEFTRTIEVGIQQKHLEEAQKIESTAQLESKLNQIEDLLDNIDTCKTTMEKMEMSRNSYFGFEIINTSPKNGLSPA